MSTQRLTITTQLINNQLSNTTMAVKRTKSGKIDKRTKEGKAMLENLAKARAAAARKRRQEDASLLRRIKRMLK